MQIFLVGGAVRDELLDREVKDHDFVVVGATEEEMLAQGFKPVGADFPVFLHPVTGDEYALARRERKTGTGYNGFTVEFDPSVTLEEDLFRRDLTINAMAKNLENGEIIDPFNGQRDIKERLFRPVAVETFIEDPVRALRMIRFQARMGNEWVATPSMSEAIRTLSESGEFKSLTKERVLLELEKALAEPNWWKFFLAHGSMFREDVLWQMGFRERVVLREIVSSPSNNPDQNRFNAMFNTFNLDGVLDFLGASDKMKVTAQVVSCVRHWKDCGMRVNTKAVEDFDLFKPQSNRFRAMVETVRFVPELEKLVKAAEAAMKVKFLDVQQDGETPQETAQRLNDRRMEVAMSSGSQ